ncbi:hypothetical protein D3C87_1911870 [compost metagenome]
MPAQDSVEAAHPAVGHQGDAIAIAGERAHHFERAGDQARFDHIAFGVENLGCFIDQRIAAVEEYGLE